MTKKTFSKPFVISLIAIISIGFIAGFALREENRAKILEIFVFDLKGNEAVFVRTPDDKRILINGGANSEIVREITKMLPFYSRKIDTVIATDTDGKNVSGLIDVLKRYSVGKVILPAITLNSLGISTTTDQIYSVFLDTIEEKGISVESVGVGDRVVFDDSDPKSPVFANILFPVAPENFKYSKASAPEIVMNIIYGDSSVTLLNDVTLKIQKQIALSTISTADALVVFNNASPDNLAPELMEKLKPTTLIYSKSLTSSSPKSTSSKDEKTDPLFYIMSENRFNLKERGEMRIVGDGVRFKVY